MFAQFEKGNLFSEIYYDAKSGDKSDDDSIIPPIISKEEIDAMDLCNEYEDEPMSTEMLEDVYDGSQTYPRVNMREARYKIRDRIKQRQSE